MLSCGLWYYAFACWLLASVEIHWPLVVVWLLEMGEWKRAKKARDKGVLKGKVEGGKITRRWETTSSSEKEANKKGILTKRLEKKKRILKRNWYFIIANTVNNRVMFTSRKYSEALVVPCAFCKDATPLFLQTDLPLALVASSDLPVVLFSFYPFLLSWNGHREFLISPLARSSKAVLSLKSWQFLGTEEPVMKGRKKDMGPCNEEEGADWKVKRLLPMNLTTGHAICEVILSPYCISMVWVSLNT